MNTGPAWTTIPSISIPALLMKYLRLEGVTHMFGVPGTPFAELLNLLHTERDVTTYVVAKHETGAGYMADGYHRAGGSLGIVIVTSGPGATNALTGAMNGQAGYSSMLVITGEQPQSKDGLDWEQEGVDLDLDVLQVYKSAVSYSAMITSADDFGILFRQALRTALGVPGQTVHLSIPRDIMQSVVSNVTFPASPAQYRASLDSASASDAQSVAAELMAAKRPMILLGNGMRDVLDPAGLAFFTALVERLGVPVGTTSDAKALFPEIDSMSAAADVGASTGRSTSCARLRADSRLWRSTFLPRMTRTHCSDPRRPQGTKEGS